MMLDSLPQLLWAFLGACSGLFIGLTKEGIDLFSTLGSMQGWKQLYTGTATSGSKKIDYGSSTPLSSQGAIRPEQAAVKQFLGTRPSELKPAQHSSRLYSNFPILGGQDASAAPAAVPVNAKLSPPRQPGPTPHTNAPVPFSLPAGTTSQASRADSLDIFGSKSLTGSQPAVQLAPVVASIPTPASAISASPLKGAAMGTVPNSHAQHEERYVADGASTPDDGSSPEAVTRTDSRMKKLSKRISSKLRSPKA